MSSFARISFLIWSLMFSYSILETITWKGVKPLPIVPKSLARIDWNREPIRLDNIIKLGGMEFRLCKPKPIDVDGMNKGWGIIGRAAGLEVGIVHGISVEITSIKPALFGVNVESPQKSNHGLATRRRRLRILVTHAFDGYRVLLRSQSGWPDHLRAICSSWKVVAQ